MKNTLTELLQLLFSAGARQAGCRRRVCRRYGHCLPPPDPGRKGLFACPFASEESRFQRSEAARKTVERLMHVHDQALARRGLPPRFAAKPQPGPRDHLDLSKPFDPTVSMPELDSPSS